MFQRLRDLREDKDLKQEYIATQVLKINRVQYVRYETGQNEIPVRHLITLAKFYNTSLDYLTGMISTPRALDASSPSVSMLESKDLIFAKKVKKAYEETYAK